MNINDIELTINGHKITGGYECDPIQVRAIQCFTHWRPSSSLIP